MDEREKEPCCDISDLSYCRCGKNRNILRRDFEEHITDLEDDDGEEVFVRCKTKVDVHAGDFRVAYGGAILRTCQLRTREH